MLRPLLLLLCLLIAPPALAQEPPRQIEIDTLEQARRQADAAERSLPLAERSAVAGEEAARAARDAVRATDDATRVADRAWKAAKDSAQYAKLGLWISGLGTLAIFAALIFSGYTVREMRKQNATVQDHYRRSTRPRLSIKRVEVSGHPLTGRILVIDTRNEGQTVASDLHVEARFDYHYGSTRAPSENFTPRSRPPIHILPNDTGQIVMIFDDSPLKRRDRIKDDENIIVKGTTVIAYHSDFDETFSLRISIDYSDNDNLRVINTQDNDGYILKSVRFEILEAT